MTTNEAILYLAIGFMIIIGIWLTALTYLVLKKAKTAERKESRAAKEPKEDESEGET